MRILALAAEAWEAKLMVDTVRRLAAARIVSEAHLALIDATLIQYEPGFVRQLELAPDMSLWHYRDRFKAWQAPQRNPAPSPLDLTSWLASMGSSMTAQALMATDTVLVPWEYQACLRKLSPQWKDFIASDLVDWSVDVFMRTTPDAILAIERRRLPSHAMQILADSFGVPMLTLIGSRIGSRWVIRHDLGLGMSGPQLDLIKACEPSPTSTERSTRIILGIQGGSPAYYSATHARSEEARVHDMDDLRRQVRTWKRLVRKIAHRHLRGGRRDQLIRARRYEQSFLRLTWWELLVQWRHSLYVLGRRKGFDRLHEASSPYVLWLLHARPEDANSSLGQGFDELQVLQELRRRLPATITLMAKENAMMIGVRRPSVYKRLRSLGIIVVPPDVDTASLLDSASGVAGMSGTALLEASVKGKPTLALGLPEFLPCLSHVGMANLDGFLRCVLDGADVGNLGLTPDEYVTWVVDNSSADDIPFLGNLDSPEGREMATTVARRFAHELQSVRRSMEEQSPDAGSMNGD